MKLQFEADLPYQREAIDAVLDVFDGQPGAASLNEFRLDAPPGEVFAPLQVANRLGLEDGQLAENVRRIQQANGIDAGGYAGRHFSVEMETGTGKTYVYLRTVHELHARYGFTKFIIVVPSIAIREGVMKTIDMTREHLAGLYGNRPLDAWVYDSRQVSRLRQFASASTLQVLVLNIDAFNKKDIAVIHKEQDRMAGRRPIEFVRAASPIVIMDEPQNMESDTAVEAIKSLNPLCTLRYSATHRNPYNLLYRLDPVRAYDLGLVKHIEVDSVLEEGDFNRPYIHVTAISAARTTISAKLEIDTRTSAGVKRRSVTIKKSASRPFSPGADLYEISGQREQYSGYMIDEIRADEGTVSFSNGHTLRLGETHGARRDDLMRVQIRETVRTHLDRELRVRALLDGERMKVLSLFFIDRVAHYADDEGKIRRWFIEAWEELAALPRYRDLQLPDTGQVHNGYFAQDKKGAKDTRGNTRADNDAYELIMRDKERLLSPEEPLRFIFSHSALREGWDNPNVFQICTLNETRSELKKRQEIGRGLRLPVLAGGRRCRDEQINRLTVIANEAYEDFARTLQTEIEDDCGVRFQGRIRNARQRRTVKLKKGWRLDADFKALWERIKHRTRYAVAYDSATLIDKAARAIHAMPAVTTPRIVSERAALAFDSAGIQTDIQSVREHTSTAVPVSVPDILGYLQHATELTRHTLVDILTHSGRLRDVLVNPQQFLDESLKAIRGVLQQLMVDGVKYERIGAAEYEMRLFESRELEAYLSNLVKVDKSITDHIEFESDVERRFAERLDRMDNVRLFVKLPGWFRIDTPVGTYNPDWAIVLECDEKLYLVRETKGTADATQLRWSELARIKCGRAHFDELGVDYEHVSSADELRCPG